MASYARITTIARSKRSELVLAVDHDAAQGQPREIALKKLLGAHRGTPTDSALQQHLVGMNVAGAHALRHLGITSFEGEPTLVMPYVRGLDLGALLAHTQRHRVKLGRATIDFIVRRVALGLREVHRAFSAVGATVGGAHGDVSAENVLVSDAGDVKITDYSSVTLVRPSDVRYERGVAAPTLTCVADEQALATLALRLAAIEADVAPALVERIVSDASLGSAAALAQLEPTLSEALFYVVRRTMTGRPRSAAPFAAFITALDGEPRDLANAIARRLGERVVEAARARHAVREEGAATEPVRFRSSVHGAKEERAAAPSNVSRMPTGRYRERDDDPRDGARTQAELEGRTPAFTLSARDGFRVVLDSMGARATGLWVWSDDAFGGELYIEDGVPISVRADEGLPIADALLRAPTCRERWIRLCCQTTGELSFYENVESVIGHGAFLDNPLTLIEEAVRYRMRAGLEDAVRALESSFALRVTTTVRPWPIEEYGSIVYERLIDDVERGPVESLEGERASGVAIHASVELVVLLLFGVIEAGRTAPRITQRGLA